MSEKIIEIPPIQLSRTMVRIVGQTPLITNRFSERARDSIEGKQQRVARGARPPREPELEFRDALHILAPGVYGFPTNGIKKALVAAGGRFADEKMTQLRGVINIPSAYVAIQSGDPTMRSDQVCLPGKKSSIAYRPQFDPWRMDVPVVFNTALIGEAQVINLFQIAGFAIGLGAWRPENNGTFGQFVLDDGAVQVAA